MVSYPFWVLVRSCLSPNLTRCKTMFPAWPHPFLHSLPQLWFRAASWLCFSLDSSAVSLCYRRCLWGIRTRRTLGYSLHLWCLEVALDYFYAKFFYLPLIAFSIWPLICPICSCLGFYVTTECVPSCSVLSDSLISMDCNPPGSSVHGIFQARILEWVAISSSRGSSWPRDCTHISCISCIGTQILYQQHLLGSP